MTKRGIGAKKCQKQGYRTIFISNLFGEYPVEVNIVNGLYNDSLGNLWMKVSDTQFVVYKPNGVKALTVMGCKCTKHEISQEE